MTSHIFFCSDADCSNIVDSMDTICNDCREFEFEGCPDCGDIGASLLGMDQCFTCWTESRRCLPPACECDGSGRLCRSCAQEYAEPCRGCGLTTLLWTDNTYCQSCYVERHGDEFPMVVTIAPPPPKSANELRAIIQEIEDKLRTNMTKEQADDWRWLLQNRRADLTEALRY